MTTGTTGPAGTSITVRVNGAEAAQRLGQALAGELAAGDLVLLSGELGAGKTTLTRGLGAGLGVRGPVASPTFVIARVHPSLAGEGPALVHVDAYRLSGGLDEMEDLELEAALPESVVVVEWGEGKVEDLSPDRLLIRLERPIGGTAAVGGAPDENDDESRTATLSWTGARWAGPAAERLATAVAAATR